MVGGLRLPHPASEVLTERKKMPKIDWALARHDWEAGLSLAKTAKKYGVSETSVSTHKKNEGWQRGEAAAVVVAADVPTVAADEIPQVVEADELARLRAELDKAKAEAAALRQDVEIHLPTTPAEALTFYGRAYFEKVARTELNRERKREGFLAVELQSGDPTLEAAVQSLAADAVKAQTKWANDESSAGSMRTLKMARPDPSSPSGWFIAGIPMEPTINNGAADPNNPLRKAAAKGFKLITPLLCYSGPCNAKAATQGGRLVYDGYCSAEHRARDPFLKSEKQVGVTGTAESYGSGRSMPVAI